jgi:hypothetical protein
VDDDELRGRLAEAGHPALSGRLRDWPAPGGDPGAMSESSDQHATEVWPHPASAAARASERWAAPARDYPAPADGTSVWPGADPPGVDPPMVAGVDGPQTRPGWLTRGRDGGGAA